MVEVIALAVFVFGAGGLLLLERRCLGQMALVQPLSVCLAAGYVTDHIRAGMWLGVALQLLASTPIQRVDWALAGVVAASSLALVHHVGYEPMVGMPLISIFVVASVLVGMAGYRFDVRTYRIEGERHSRRPVFAELEPRRAIERLVLVSVVRGFVTGGVMSVLGTVFVLGSSIGWSQLVRDPALGGEISAVAIPALGVAVLVGSLPQYRFAVIALAAAAVSFVVVLV